jgi:uncharacterized protein (DUF2267 family)
LTNVWLKDILDQLKWQSKSSAYQALRSTLHALRDRLRVEEAVQLAAQLLLLIKGVYYDAGHSWISLRNIKKRNLQEECMSSFSSILI